MTTDLETIVMLRDSLGRYSADHYSFLQRLEVLQTPEGFSRKVWHELAEMGFLSLCLPLADDGLDADTRTVGALMEVVGQRLLQEPLLISGVLATTLIVRLADQAQKEQWLPALSAGERIVSCVLEPDCAVQIDGVKLSAQLPLAVHGDCADALLLVCKDHSQTRVALIDLDQSGVQRKPSRLLDGRGSASLKLDQVTVEWLGALVSQAQVDEVVSRVTDLAHVALCAEACGVIEALLETTNAYLKVRKQFGQPLAVNQALQHRMADLYLFKQEALALTRAAEQALDGAASEERALRVSAARAYVGRAARQLANEAVQLHGGLGITEELDVSHYFRRVMLLNNMFGSAEQQFQRFIECSLAVFAAAD